MKYIAPVEAGLFALAGALVILCSGPALHAAPCLAPDNGRGTIVYPPAQGRWGRGRPV